MTDTDLKYRVLKILEQEPHLTQRQLAKKLGISLGKAHYLIKSLINVGWVKFENFQQSDNKLSYAYILTPKGIVEKSAITTQFLSRKKREYNELQKEIAQLQKEVSQQENLKN